MQGRLAHRPVCWNLQAKNLKCYSLGDYSKHAGKGAPGRCFVAHQKECAQETSGDESSGGCRGNTVCRKFRYQIYQLIPQPSRGYYAYPKDKLYHDKERSYCIDPQSAADNALNFVSGEIVTSSITTDVRLVD
mmetsp:Transcript_34815/g.87817  ORF Transcript_34815/g.87817 Transcript_34815/m.87817 type:complete len:133 (+) Transcript_34815:225-623(+)